MNQNSAKINLINFVDSDHPYGNVQGKATFRKLADYIDSHPQSQVFGISLADIVATDASFPRESVVAVAKQYRGQKAIYLEGVKDRDIIDNWQYAAKAKDQPIIVWTKDGFEVIGPDLSSSNKALIDCVVSNGPVTAAKVANDLDMSVQNASTRLKKLVEQGYLMRTEEVAESGGIEYIYHPIK